MVCRDGRPDYREGRASQTGCTLHDGPAFSEMFVAFVAYLLAGTIRVEEDMVDQLFNSSQKRLANHESPVLLPSSTYPPLRCSSARILCSSSLLLRLTRRRARCTGPFLYLRLFMAIALFFS
jgi:hypothetical protein